MPALPTDTAPPIAEEFAANETGVLTPASFLNVVPEDVASNIFVPASESAPRAIDLYAVPLACGPRATALFALALANEPNAIASRSVALAV